MRVKTSGAPSHLFLFPTAFRGREEDAVVRFVALFQRDTYRRLLYTGAGAVVTGRRPGRRRVVVELVRGGRLYREHLGRGMMLLGRRSAGRQQRVHFTAW